MTSTGHEFSLPRVVEDDLLNDVLHADIADPTHKDRWLDFVRSNKVLAREVLKRAFAASGGNLERQKEIIDEVTFTYAALAAAAIRLSGSTEQLPTSVGDVDGGLQPLA